jgi:hypothetical protein
MRISEAWIDPVVWPAARLAVTALATPPATPAVTAAMQRRVAGPPRPRHHRG